MDSLLNSLYTTASNLVICGDFNVNFNENFSGPITRVHLLESLLATYNLHKTITFSTRNLFNSKTTIDNIFIDINKLRFSTKPLINGLSDHDAQIIVLYDILCSSNKHQPTYSRIIDEPSSLNFLNMLSCENWESILQETDVTKCSIHFTTYILEYLTFVFLLKEG
jgi:hypothetical protein